jgi:uncharacterized protein with NAD-binding domain and iron-sulfur cluster
MAQPGPPAKAEHRSSGQSGKSFDASPTERMAAGDWRNVAIELGSPVPLPARVWRRHVGARTNPRDRQVMKNGREKIAVLGGGVGALSAAFYLTEQPGWADRYEITVYQQGWRLGGKCASGHDMRPGYGHRIYEHGLHIFAGFYDQAFDLLRRAYDSLERPGNHPNQTVWDAFTPEDNITLVDRSVAGSPNLMWYMDFPPNDQVPGEDLSVAPLAVMIQRMVGLLVHVSPPVPKLKGPVSPNQPPEGIIGTLIDEAVALIDKLVTRVKNQIEDVVADVVLHQVIHLLEQQIRTIQGSNPDRNTAIMNERFLNSVYLAQTIIHGVVADDVLEKGYDSLDKYEWSEWVHANAMAVARKYPEWGDPATRAQKLLDWPPIASLYDYVFGYGDSGDVTKPNFAAGTALRSGMLMISYRGHFFWKMRGAMGDVVIAPLYLALLRRGVKFEFFSRVTGLNIDPQKDQLASIDIAQQVTLKAPADGYQPLIGVPIPGWPADVPLEGWPAEPLWSQLVDGEALRAAGRDFEADHKGEPGAGDIPRRLKLGVDFDRAIIGISLGGLKQVCSSFPARLPQSNWGPMFGAVTTTRTCAMQLWFTRSMDDLGSKGSDRTLAGADQPFSAWSDMSHLLTRETWSGPHVPRSIGYFCGQIQGPENGKAADRKARDLAVQWLTDNSQLYWERATSPSSPYGLDPNLLHDPEPGAGGDVLTRQYIRANCNPSDLYVQSPKGSVFTRMDANQSGLDNLLLAGDWTLNGINSGCAESAARSGWRCAQAVAGTLKPYGT